MRDEQLAPGWLRKAQLTMSTLRELFALVLIISSLLTAGALYATRGIREDVRKIDHQSKRVAEAVELLVVVTTESDSTRRSQALQAIANMRRVVTRGDE